MNLVGLTKQLFFRGQQFIDDVEAHMFTVLFDDTDRFRLSQVHNGASHARVEGDESAG